jgi:hypothetical protein
MSIAFEDYSNIEAMNWSTLKQIDISPAWLKHRIDHPEESDDKAAWRQGRTTHCATLEPERFIDDYVVEPDFAQMARDKFGSLRTKEAQLYRDVNSAEWFEKNNRPGVEVISQSEMDIALRSARAIRANPIAARLLERSKCEQVIRWHDPETGIECKGRVDINCGRIVDLKTTRRSTIREILADAVRFGYHGQVAWYHDGAVLSGVLPKDSPLPAAIFVNASANTTFADVAVLDMSLVPWTFEAGQRLYRKLIQLYMGCKIADKWPGMAPAIVPWTLPDWAMLENGEDEI